MALINQTLRSLLGGVSQKPAIARDSSRFDLLENALVSQLHGLMKRPPTSRIATLDSTPYTNKFFHWVNRSPSERYVLGVVDGALKAWNLADGSAVSVLTPAGSGYLTDTAGFRAITVGDYTFLVNRATVVQKGTKKAPQQAHEALIWVQQAQFSTTYSVTLNGVALAIATADQSNATNLSTTNICADLKTTLETNALLTQFQFTQYGSTLYLTRTDGADFSLSVSDGMGDQALKAIKGTVQSMVDLPSRAKAGMILNVVGDPGSAKDDTWVAYDDTGANGQAGVWRECAAPGTPLNLDHSTMPWAAVLRGDVLDDISVGDLPKSPTVSPAATTSYTAGFIKDADTATAYDGDTVVVAVDDGKGYEASPSSFDGNSRTVRVYFDIDTTSVKTGDQVTVEISNDSLGTFTFTSGSTKTFDAGKVYTNQYIEQIVSWPSGTKIQARLRYASKGLSPGFTAAARLSLHRSSNAGAPGVLHFISAATDIVFDPTYVYPGGTQFSFDIRKTDGTGGGFFGHTVTADSETGASVATALAATINAGGGSYTPAFSATNPSSGVCRVQSGTHAAKIIPGVHPWAWIDPTAELWSSSLSMTPGEHVGRTIRNVSDGSSGTITANGSQFVQVSSLSGGVANKFQAGDVCAIDSAGTYFVLSQVPWNDRGVGSLDTAPFPSFTGKAVSEVFFYQNRLGFTSGSNVILSASGDLFRFFRKTVTDVLADDPIDIASAHSEVTVWESAVEWQERLVLFSQGRHQFALTGNPALTPSTVQLEHIGAWQCSGACRPRAVGTKLIFFQPANGVSSRCLEMFLNPYSGKPEVQELTAECPTYISGDPVDFSADATLGFTAVATAGSSGQALFVQSQIQKDQQATSAWAKWTFNAASVIGLSLIDEFLYLLLVRGSSVVLERIPLSNLDTITDYSDAGTDAYVFVAKPSTLFLRDQNDRPALGGRLQLRYLKVYFDGSGTPFTVKVTPAGRPEVDYRFDGNDPKGFASVPVLCRNTDATIEITDDAKQVSSASVSGANGPATPLQSNDCFPAIPQNVTNFDNQAASKYLIVADGWDENLTGLIINSDGTLDSTVGTPEGLAINAVVGCPLDASNAFVALPKDANTGIAYQRAYRFDWTAKTYTRVTDPPWAPGSYASGCAVRLANGKILVVIATAAYIFDPAAAGGSGSWTATAAGSLGAAFGILLPNGKVLVGVNQVYDPVGDSWANTTNPPTNSISGYTGDCAVLLHSGKVAAFDNLGSLYLYDPTAGAWDNGTAIPGLTHGPYVVCEYAPNKLLLLNINGAGTAYTYDIDAGTSAPYSDTAKVLGGGWLEANTFFAVNAEGQTPANRIVRIYTVTPGASAGFAPSKKPLKLTAIEWEGQFTSRSRGQ